MTAEPWTLAVIAVMTVAAALCRFGGFWFMGFVPLSGRVRAGLDAMPLAVMLGIILPPALKGSTPEWAGLLAAGLVAYASRSELGAVLAGMLAVAAMRWAGL